MPGLFAAGDVAGGCPQKYVTGAFAEGAYAAEGAARYAAAQEVLRRVGRHIGQINREMAPLLLPRTNVRYLFGRFVKEPAGI